MTHEEPNSIDIIVLIFIFDLHCISVSVPASVSFSIFTVNLKTISASESSNVFVQILT